MSSIKDFEILSTLGKLISSLGSGAYSTVFKVKRINDGAIYALKSKSS